MLEYPDGVNPYQDGLEDGKKQEQERIIKILEDSWLSGTIAHHIIDDIIAKIKQ